MQIGNQATLGHLPRNLTPNNGGQLASDGQQALQVDAGIAAHGLEHVNGVFAADIAAGSGRVGATAQATQRSIETIDAGLHGRQHIGQAHASGVVKVKRELQARELLAKGLA